VPDDGATSTLPKTVTERGRRERWQQQRARTATRTAAGSVVQTVRNPRAPIYILAGHAGAGFTHAFPDPLPEWVEHGAQDANGYLRVTVRGGSLTAVSISTDDGRVMDGVEIVKVPAS
jgi:hypothetical protein